MSNKDDAAWDVERLWLDFQMGLDNKRKYPIQQFNAYAQVVRRYLDLTRNDPLFHKKVVWKINGLTDSLSLERKRVPDGVLMEAHFRGVGYPRSVSGEERPGAGPNSEGQGLRPCGLVNRMFSSRAEYFGARAYAPLTGGNTLEMSAVRPALEFFGEHGISRNLLGVRPPGHSQVEHLPGTDVLLRPGSRPHPAAPRSEALTTRR